MGMAIPQHMWHLRGSWDVVDTARHTSSLCMFNLVSSDGSLWVPLVASVRRFSDDGNFVTLYKSESYGISKGILSVAFDAMSGLIFLASQHLDPPQPLVAVNAKSSAVVWTAESPGACYGLAVLPSAGIIVMGCYSMTRALRVHRLSDGVLIATAEAPQLSYMTLDVESSTIFASTQRGVVRSFRWDGTALIQAFDPIDLRLHLAGTSHNPLCIMPDDTHDSDSPSSLLVVGVQETADVMIFSLGPPHGVGTLLRKFRLARGIEVAGLAADSSGCALVVMDSNSHVARVLQWPLMRESIRIC